MCGSNGFDGGCCCCPSPKIKVEKLCGNFNGPLLVGSTDLLAWYNSSANNGYFQGTFEITVNRGNGVSGTITTATGNFNFNTILPSESQVISVNRPTRFTVDGIQIGDSGEWCITLYKRVSG